MGGGPSLPASGRRALADGVARLRDALGASRVLLLVHDHPGGDLRRALPDDTGPARVRAGSPAYAAILRGGELDPAALGGAIPAWSFPLRAAGEGLGALVVEIEGSMPDARARLVATVAATVLALWQRNAELFAGLRDRAVALDRQLLQMRALTEIAHAAGGGGGVEERRGCRRRRGAQARTRRRRRDRRRRSIGVGGRPRGHGCRSRRGMGRERDRPVPDAGLGADRRAGGPRRRGPRGPSPHGRALLRRRWRAARGARAAGGRGAGTGAARRGSRSRAGGPAAIGPGADRGPGARAGAPRS